jgi:hypothetical protein
MSLNVFVTGTQVMGNELLLYLLCDCLPLTDHNVILF